MKNNWRSLVAKLSKLRRSYGDEAKKYFVENFKCEKCSEERLAALAIHHTEGKHINKFITLCHNCHFVEHYGDATFENSKKDSWKKRVSPNEAEHGMLTKYRNGCRCDLCKLAKAEDNRKYKTKYRSLV